MDYMCGKLISLHTEAFLCYKNLETANFVMFSGQNMQADMRCNARVGDQKVQL